MPVPASEMLDDSSPETQKSNKNYVDALGPQELRDESRNRLQHHEDVDDEDEDEGNTDQDDDDADMNITYLANVNEENKEDDNFDAPDDTEDGTSSAHSRGVSDLKDELDGDAEGTSQDDEIMEGEIPSDEPRATSSQGFAADTLPQYSTRGRNHPRDSDVDILREKAVEVDEVAKPVGASFLDSLGETERRTRTRFLPSVNGFHALHKAEVKQDLQLARMHMSSNGVATKLNSKPQNKNRRDDETEKKIDEELVGSTSEEEQIQPDSTMSALSSTLIDSAYVIPSRAFIVPPDEDTESSPHVVETVTAFNPPPLPESVASKQKHRMMRWELNPAVVETDLSTYRKTVARTRMELTKAQAEQERMESVSAHLRAHFLGQIKALEQEGLMLNEEFSSTQLECVKAADLLQSRTRSRGVGKGSYVMKDVLQVLKQKGAEISTFPIQGSSNSNTKGAVGVGGVPFQALKDWERMDEIEPTTPASAWILPGQTVRTPYGSGKVIHVYGPVELNVAEPPVTHPVVSSPQQGGAHHGFGHADTSQTNTNGLAKAAASSDVVDKKTPKMNPCADQRGEHEAHERLSKLDALVAPRVCVRLPFGVAFFNLKAISFQEDASTYSDAMLVTRWKNIMESGLSMAGCIDPSAMADLGATTVTSKEKKNEFEEVHDEAKKEAKDTLPADLKGKSKPFLPYGSSLLPTSAGRAVRLADASITALEEGLNSKLFASCAVLGEIDNKGVPSKFREWEDIRDELSLVRAQVLQRRNELARQRRLRVMNERALVATSEKAARVETLVSEMRADLKSLKDRLDYELMELGEFNVIVMARESFRTTNLRKQGLTGSKPGGCSQLTTVLLI